MKPWYAFLTVYLFIGWILFTYNVDLVIAKQPTRSRVRRTTWLVGTSLLWPAWVIFRICISDTVRKLTDTSLKHHSNEVYTDRLNRYVNEAKAQAPSSPDDPSSKKEG